MTLAASDISGVLAGPADDARPRITVLQNSPDVPLGLLGAVLGDAVRIVRLDLGETVPALGAVGAGLVVLGGQMSAYDDVVAPWLPAVRALLVEAAGAGVPTLGICLGAQLLAVAHGGSVVVGAPPGREAGVIDVRWRDAAAADPVLGAVAAAAGGSTRAVSMHADAVAELPAGAQWLGWSQQYPYQAFRIGSALGVQFHPEAGKSITLGWARHHDDVDAAAVDAAMTRDAASLAHLVIAVGRAFAAQVDAYAAR
ncbi:type 1 glutamine amidotransferase [Xylanimonas protaetiae]|uniref:Type 1 glutamine amidotransferase n=1 Tax=Xylanimonas protaetiae TaxID=2509457 RepID=A0A4P6F336_9MICO|nr:type 1 glutamine amidotransferase [Xylanimonas protaetiae]QAY69153.1 type 1 glutamine amidotransferase [Xylanimonas protaetiae]